MEKVIEIVRHTPVWVFFIFAYLLVVGIRSTKTRIISIKRIMIMPLVFLIWSGVSMVVSGQFENVIVGWIALLPIGILAGYLQTRNLAVLANRELGQIKIPGSSNTLIIILLTFSVKYFAGFMNSQYPAIAHGNVFQLVIFSLSGFFTGIFIGRMIVYLYRYNTMKESELTA